MSRDQTRVGRGSALPGWVEKRTAATPLPADVCLPAPFDDADQRAFKALRDGTATAEQQHRALGWIFFATGYRGQTYRSGAPDDTAFAQGRRHLAIQIYDLLEWAVRGAADSEQGDT